MNLKRLGCSQIVVSLLTNSIGINHRSEQQIGSNLSIPGQIAFSKIFPLVAKSCWDLFLSSKRHAELNPLMSAFFAQPVLPYYASHLSALARSILHPF